MPVSVCMDTDLTKWWMQYPLASLRCCGTLPLVVTNNRKPNGNQLLLAEYFLMSGLFVHLALLLPGTLM